MEGKVLPAGRGGGYPKAKTRRVYLLLFAVVLLLAFALRVWGIESRPVWFDEGVEYQSATGPFTSIPQTVMLSFQPPMYTYVLRVWSLFGIQPFWLRFLSVAFSMVTVAGAMIIGRQMISRRAGLVAGLVLAALPSQIRYAQEIAEYALMGCAVAWSLYFLYRAHHRSNWKNWLAWILSSMVAILSQYGAVLVVGPLSAAMLVEHLARRRWSAVIKQAATGFAGTAVVLPILAYFLPGQLGAQGMTDVRLALGPPASELWRLTAGTGELFAYQLSLSPYTRLPKWPSEALAAGIVAVATAALISKGSPGLRRSAGWFLLVLAVYLVAVRLGFYAYGTYGFRYTLITGVPVAIAFGAGMEHLARRKLGLLAACVLAAALLVAGGQAAQGYSTWPEAAEDLQPIVADCWLKQSGPGVLTYVYYAAVPSFEYYRQLYGVRQAAVVHGDWFRQEPIEVKMASVEKGLGGHPERLWLVFSHVYKREDEELMAELSAWYSPTITCRSQGASAFLFERR